jgi:hypothetical protein
MRETNRTRVEMAGQVFEATLRSNEGSWQASYLVNHELGDADCAEGQTEFFEAEDDARDWLGSAAKSRGFDKYRIVVGSWT